MSDFHGRDPTEEIAKLNLEGIERIAFLGDYDSPELFRKIKRLPGEKIILAGNHDYEFANGRTFNTPRLPQPPDFYIEIWNMYPEDKREIIARPKIIVEKSKGKKIIYVHGALVDSDLDPDVNPLIAGRIDSTSKKRDNFEKMKQQDYWILFRGHDHLQNVISIPNKGNPQKAIIQEYENLKRIDLEETKRYIITVGCFADGFYSIFDNRARILEIRKI